MQNYVDARVSCGVTQRYSANGYGQCYCLESGGYCTQHAPLRNGEFQVSDDSYYVKIPRQKGKRIIKMTAISYATLVELMLDGTYDCMELAEMTGLHYVTVLQYTREMHRAGACHISSWGKDGRGRDLRKIYKIGKGRDAKRQSLSRNEISARYRAKRKHTELLRRMAA